MDDQGSVAGHVDSGRDQTVSSPLHPSAPQPRLPTPDPFAGGQWGEEQDPGSKTAGAGAGTGADLQGADGTQGSAQERNSLEGFKSLGQLQGQGPGKGRGLIKGQRPSSAPTSPVAAPGKMVKPTRCQQCHTCRHKQLKKQCLRNKVYLAIQPPASPCNILHNPPWQHPRTTLASPLRYPCTPL